MVGKVVAAVNDYVGYGSIYQVFSSSRSTFDELSSTVNLKIIRDTELRDKLVLHYANHKQTSE